MTFPFPRLSSCLSFARARALCLFFLSSFSRVLSIGRARQIADGVTSKGGGFKCSSSNPQASFANRRTLLKSIF